MNPISMNPILITERLRLRLVETSDLEYVHSLLSLPETDRYNTQGIPAGISDTQLILTRWLEESRKTENRLFPFIIGLQQDAAPIGIISLRMGPTNYKRAEISYKTHLNFWGKGYTTEALAKLIQYGFEDLGLHRIHAGCAVDNIASVRVLEKVGMQREGRLRQNLPLKTGWSDNFEYSILETDWFTT
jgi:[ribosomal protein S5]-alanine N-acetyltransferase